MKRYIIFGLIGPAIGGFLLLLVTTYLSGYWTETSLSEVTKFFVVAASTLQYSYLFGLLPCLIFAALDEVLTHIPRIHAIGRMLICGVLAFFAAAFLYGSRGVDSGAGQFILYGLIGFVPATLSSWLASRWCKQSAAAVPA